MVRNIYAMEVLIRRWKKWEGMTNDHLRKGVRITRFINLGTRKSMARKAVGRG
jgi:hypothetical protein